MSARAGISTYRRFPKELFRVNIGWRVHLLPRLTSTPDGFFDIATEHEPGTSVRDGKVLPRVFDPDYERECFQPWRRMGILVLFCHISFVSHALVA